MSTSPASTVAAPAAMRALLDNLPDAAAALDCGGTVVALNAAWTQLGPGWGADEAPPSSVEGSPWLPWFVAAAPGSAGDQEALAEGLRAVAAAERFRCDFDYFYPREGEARCLSVTLSRLHIGDFDGVLVQARSAIEPLLRRQAQMELREERERFERMMSATSEGVFLADQGRVIDANPAALEMLGYTAEQIVGMDAVQLVAPDALEVVMQRIRTEVSGLYEAALLRSDGSRFPVELMPTAVPYQGRTVRGVAVRDITERTRADAARREGEERFRLLAELTSEALVMLDGGVAVEANTAFANLLGYRKEDVIGKPAMDFVAPDSRERAREAIASMSEAPYELNALHRDGSLIPALVTGKRLPFQGRALRGTVLRDLRQKREAEALLRRTIAQEEKLSAQAAVMAGLSTPLIPISDRIVVMPLVGAIDDQRAEMVLEALLGGIQGTGATVAILDMTGVPEADARVAAGLTRVARAARLIGARVVLTGIRPEVARAFLAIGADLSGIITRGTLQSGIAEAMALSGSRG